jgi:hypothetical protein
VEAIGEHYQAAVHLRNFHVSLFPHPILTGGGLTLGYPNRPGAPPLISIQKFTIEANWLGLLRHPARLRDVRFIGLRMNILPKRSRGSVVSKKKRRHRLPPLYFQSVSADGTVLTILSKKPKKPPLEFAISRLRLRSVGKRKAMTFHATLTNPKPLGQIQTKGNFGPWNPDDPGQTPVSGSYAFRNADLSTIRGLVGTLSSRGQYDGRLNLIRVYGETDTPDFGLDLSPNRLSLRTHFEVVVDGLNGDTLLFPVWAELGHSQLLVRGGVVRTTEMKGKTIHLIVTADQANLRDLLFLAVKSGAPPLVGPATVYTRLDLPPGAVTVAQRLRLNGYFVVRSGHFTDPSVEEKIVHLSERGEGKHGQEQGQTVFVGLKGRFALSSSVMSFSSLSFDVPGAAIQLHGTYGLRDEDLNFLGTLRLKAKLSQTTTGFKSLLLRPIDPLFKGKGAGTVLPIKIGGTKQHPSFGLQFGKILKRFK